MGAEREPVDPNPVWLLHALPHDHPHHSGRNSAPARMDLERRSMISSSSSHKKTDREQIYYGHIESSMINTRTLYAAQVAKAALKPNHAAILQAATKAQEIFATYTQEKVDHIFAEVAKAANKERLPLAKAARDETGKLGPARTN